MITQEKVNRKEYYRIFYSTEQKRFILACIVTEIVWYERYFSLAEEEYNLFFTDRKYLNRIAQSCSVLGRVSPRFLGSQKQFENRTEEQQTFAGRMIAEINQKI